MTVVLFRSMKVCGRAWPLRLQYIYKYLPLIACSRAMRENLNLFIRTLRQPSPNCIESKREWFFSRPHGTPSLFVAYNTVIVTKLFRINFMNHWVGTVSMVYSCGTFARLRQQFKMKN